MQFLANFKIVIFYSNFLLNMGHFNEYHYDVEKMVTYFADILVTQILSVEVVAK